MTKPKTPVSDWRQQRLLEWLCTPKVDRMPALLGELATEMDTPLGTLRAWKEDPDFLKEWETVYRRTVGSPARKQRVLDELFDTATDRTDPRQVSAAKAYLEAVDAVRPQKIDVVVTNTTAKDLSDEELFELLAKRAAEELEARQNA